MCCQRYISTKQISVALIAILFSINICFAKYLSPEEAILRVGETELSKTMGVKTKNVVNSKLLKTITISDDKKAAVYLFSTAPNKIMAVSANDCAPAILGYFDNDPNMQLAENLPSNVEWWLKQYASQIEYVEANPGTKIITANNKIDIPIGPLLTTKWNQSAPYNSKCPIDDNGEQTVTGCVATAIAQVLNYHKWPKRGQGSNSYTYNGNTYSINFSEIEFEWDLMLDEYDNQSDSSSCDAVATLMKACGYSVNMRYGSYVSSAITSDLIKVGPKYFNYSNAGYYAERNNYTLLQWTDLLYDQLSKGMPLIYTGRDGIWLNSTGHCFVCDGCDENQYFHFNWGWGGYCDGYFALTDLTPGGVGIGGSSSGYNVRQGCVVNFHPANADIENIVSYTGTQLIVNNTLKTISTTVSPEETTLAKEQLTFGIEFTTIDEESSIVLPIGEFSFANNCYKPSYTINPDELYAIGLADGSYKVRFVYKEADNWKHLLHSVGDVSVIMAILNASDIQLSIVEENSPITISDVKINDCKLLLRGKDNTLTYIATNNSDKPIYWASWHFLVAENANVSQGTSLYNTNLILAANESRKISIPITAAKIESLANGKYYIAVSAGEELDSRKYIYTNSSEMFNLVDDQVAISDGIYNYIKEDQENVVLIGLSNPETKLVGDVVIPQKAVIDSTEYNISTMLCSISDLIDIKNVTSVDIQFPLLTIPNNIFKNATALKSITLPKTITTIGSSAFYGCSGLTCNLILPESLTSIGSSAFYNCSSLTGDLIIPDNLTSIGSSAFAGCKGFLGNLTLPDKLTSINSQVFYNCSGLTGDLIIPDNITSIGSSAFAGCKGFSGVLTLPKNLTTIERSVFSGCSGFTGSLKIPNTVEKIDNSAFYNCKGLTAFICDKEIPATASSSAFSSISTTAPLYVPMGTKETYANSVGWNIFKTIIERDTTINLNPLTDGVFDYIQVAHDRVVLKGLSNIESKLVGDVIIPKKAVIDSIEYDINTFLCPISDIIDVENITSVDIQFPLLTIPDYTFKNATSLKSIRLPESLTSIGISAFNGCSSLTGDLILPDSITSIGASAFYGCSGLSGNLTLPKKLTKIENSVFNNCSGLTGSLILPDGITSIGSSSFYGCSGFTGNLILPDSLTSIGASAFHSCSGLTGDLILPDKLTKIDNRTFYGCSGFTGNLILPKNLITIGTYSFYNCSGLTGNLILPDGLTSIGASAFYHCSGLTGNLTFPNNTTSIGSSAFSGCSGFTGNLTLPNSITSIGASAFYGCSGFTGNLTLPNNITTIESSAFYYCNGFKGNLTLPNNVTSIGSSAFYCCSGLTGNLTLPNSITSIGASAFYGCSGFTGKLELPNKLTKIGNHIFYGCSGFTGNLTLPDSITSIGSSAFYNCKGLTGSIKIPNSVESIGSYLFYNCKSLTSFISENAVPPTAYSSTFSGISTSAPLYVPVGSKEAYANAVGWNVFKNIIEDETTAINTLSNDDVKVYIENGKIIVTDNGKCLNMKVYDINGRCIYSGLCTTISVDNNGIYIVKVNNKIIKVTL